MINKKIIILSGGSGGHVFPGITIAKALLEKKWKVHWIGTKNHIESFLVPKNGIPIDFISIKSFKRNSLLSLILTPLQLFKAYKQSELIINRYKPDIILAMGGYISAPGGIVAYRKKIPLIIHEQNKVIGLTNKILNKLSNKTLEAFPKTFTNATLVGNPIRSNLCNITPPKERFKNKKGPIKILILGGSQGSMAINKIIPTMSLLLKKKVLIWHQIGDNITQELKVFYSIKRDNIYKTSIFIKNMKIAYIWADLVISRGGALTVSEITTIGIGAIFIPYPHKDMQQYWNVLPLYKCGAAKIISQEKVNSSILATIISKLTRKKLISMAEKSRTTIHLHSTQKIVKTIEQTFLLNC